MRLIGSALLSMLMSSVASAQSVDMGPFNKFFERGAPKCIPISQIREIVTPVRLTPAQFEFSRGFFTAIPPLSEALPDGDRAYLAVSGGAAMVLIGDESQSCARFGVPSFLMLMLMKVGEGETPDGGL